MTETQALEAELARLKKILAENYRALRTIKGLLIIWSGLDDSQAIRLIDSILEQEKQ